MKHVFVREAERRLDAKVYLEEQKWWLCSGLHLKYLCCEMFVHTATMGQKEHVQVIYHGQREQSLPQSFHEQATAMESINPNFIWEENWGLYQEVYQLQRLPSRSHCEVATEEQLQEEILASIREHLRLGLPLED